MHEEKMEFPRKTGGRQAFAAVSMEVFGGTEIANSRRGVTFPLVSVSFVAVHE